MQINSLKILKDEAPHFSKINPQVYLWLSLFKSDSIKGSFKYFSSLSLPSLFKERPWAALSGKRLANNQKEVKPWAWIEIKVLNFSPLQDNFVSLILPELIGWGWILLFPGASRPGEQRPEPSQKAFSPRNFLGARSRRSFLRARTSQRQPHSDALPAKQPLLKHW